MSSQALSSFRFTEAAGRTLKTVPMHAKSLRVRPFPLSARGRSSPGLTATMFGAYLMITPTAGVVAGLIDNFVERFQTTSDQMRIFFRDAQSQTEEIPDMRLVADDLTVSRADQIFFAGISFSLAAGEALLVTGPNGVGKSTLLREIAGLLPLRRGNLRLEGVDCEAVGEACHYLGHRNAMKPDLTVRENLLFWRRFMPGLRGTEGKAAMAIEEATGAVGLGGIEHLPYGILSAGQQRRIALARLLTVHRPVWILDEPTSAMDGHSVDLFAGLVRNHLAGGGILVAATHQPLGLDAAHPLVLDPKDRVVQEIADPFLDAGAG
jgi:heme exporter protein A